MNCAYIYIYLCLFTLWLSQISGTNRRDKININICIKSSQSTQRFKLKLQCPPSEKTRHKCQFCKRKTASLPTANLKSFRPPLRATARRWLPLYHRGQSRPLTPEKHNCWDLEMQMALGVINYTSALGGSRSWGAEITRVDGNKCNFLMSVYVRANCGKIYLSIYIHVCVLK